MCFKRRSGYSMISLRIICLTLVIIPTFPRVSSVKSLHPLSYSVRAFETDQKRTHLWFPTAPSGIKPDFRPVQLCDNQEFQQLNDRLNALVHTQHDRTAFEWTSVSLISLPGLKRSYILVSGSSVKSHSTQGSKLSVTPRDGGSVYLCELEEKNSESNSIGFGPSPVMCIRLSEERGAGGSQESLGASVSSIMINDTTAVLAYCDPLWRATRQVPVGRCFLRILADGVLKSSLELSEFCQSGLNVANPCMAGQSVHLSHTVDAQNDQTSDRTLPNVKVWVGEPLFLPHGRVQVVNDPYGDLSITTVEQPNFRAAMGSYFGFTVTDGYASAPGVPLTQLNQNENVAQLFGLRASADTVPSVDWVGGSEKIDGFSGYGTSLLRINLEGSLNVAIVVGAPYMSLTSPNASVEEATSSHSSSTNRGRIYLYCHPEGRFRTTAQPDLVHPPNDSLYGPPESTYFGFALSSLGDIDGDGIGDLAVGSPDLDHLYQSGKVYLIRLLPNCKFDPVPVQVLQGSQGTHDFGARLPSKAEDIDFNLWPDLVIPTIKSSSQSREPIQAIYASRSRLLAECRFYFPSWLAIKRMFKGDIIPVGVTVFLSESGRSLEHHQATKNIVEAEQDKKLVHQIIADWNATTFKSQRFLPTQDIDSSVEKQQNTLRINFGIKAQKDIQDMIGIESPEGGVYVGYRFIEPCRATSQTIDENGTCADATGLRRPLIDWTGCIAKVPLSRYVCYPRSTCESDVALKVTDLSTQRVLFYNNTKFDQIHSDEIRLSKKQKLSSTVKLTFGNMDSSRPELLVDVYNFGPTFAGGVWLDFQFKGNLRFARLEPVTSTSQPLRILSSPMVSVSENETWAQYFMGTLPAPAMRSESGVEENALQVRLKLSTYYKHYASLNMVNYSLGAGVTISLTSGTPDPFPMSNSVHFDYTVVHSPDILITQALDTVHSILDNRTEATAWIPGPFRRIKVADIGPRIKHTMQVEYLGPSARLNDVLFRLSVPVQLSVKDRSRESENYIVYIFKEIRARQQQSNGLKWNDLWPKVVTLNTSSPSGYTTVAQCTVEEPKNAINPRGLIGMDTSGVVNPRQRREAIYVAEEVLDDESSNAIYQNNSRVSGAAGSSSITHSHKSFRRVTKEILQCDRIGYRVKQPVCAQIVCRLAELPKNRPVLITFTGWLWARTMFAKHISDLDLATTLSVSQGTVPDGVRPAPEPAANYHLTQTIYFPHIRPKLLHQIPIWPIIVGVVLGVICFALIVILLHEVGFFKRHRPPLREAQYSRGGASELERTQQDSPEAAFHGGFGPDRSGISKKKNKRKLKNKGELTILHPVDLAEKGGVQERERLIDDSPSMRKSQQYDNDQLDNTAT